MHLSRRSFLIGLPIAIAGVAGYRYRHRIEAFLPGDQPRKKLLSFVKYPSHAAIIGGVYLNQYPLESESEMLVSRLSDKLALDLTLASDSDIEKALLRTIKDDYTNFQTILLDGWLLSRTECLLAALVAVSGYH